LWGDDCCGVEVRFEAALREKIKKGGHLDAPDIGSLRADKKEENPR